MTKKQDYDLIFLCAENCRAKIKEMSILLKKSSQRLKYSINVLEKEEIITNPHTIVDYSYFRLIMFRVYFKGGYIGERDKNKIIEYLKNNPYITSIYELTGEYDLIIEALSPNPSRFNKEIKKIITQFPTLNNYKIILNLVTYLYPSIFILENQELAKIIRSYTLIGGDRPLEEFNENEIKIIKNLLENPKIRFTTLAKKSEVNVKTANKIIKDLKKRKIIRGFKNYINTNKLEIYKYRLFLKLHNLEPEREQELKEFLLITKEVIIVNKTIGDWDMEIDIESLTKVKIRYIIVKLREDFKDIIENFNIMEFYDQYKKTYLPRYLFEDEEKN